MAKRLHEDVANADAAVQQEQATKKAKKQKLAALGAEERTGENASKDERKKMKRKMKENEKATETDAVNAAVESEEKKDEKALKRAKKEAKKAAAAQEAATSVAEGTGDLDAAAKAEKKAAKAAEKAAKKAAKVGEASAKTTDSEAVVAKVSAAAPSSSSSGYTEHAELTALPQSQIDAFLTEKMITIDAKEPLRPLTSFKYLPVSEDQRTPFKNFTTPTPIQAGAWPHLFAFKDVIGVAETGSGKTLAFGVPTVSRLSTQSAKERKSIKACIVSPTRELACQIHDELAKLSKPYNIKIAVVYGGVPKDAQRVQLNGANIVVATPGRLNDYIQEGSIDLSKVEHMILDEADRMLDKGFEQEIRKIISTTPTTGKQTVMFTATWPPSVRDLAATFMKNPVKVAVGDNPTGELRANVRITQTVEVMEQHDKQNRLIELLKQYQSGKNKSDRILVFCLYKKEATRIEEFIARRGFKVGGIHGDLPQHKRTESLDAFKRGDVPILVATDVAARGLDIPNVKVVINVTFPLTAEDYVHRIGR
jgi:ATP-dependent RNA helicase DBP3